MRSSAATTVGARMQPRKVPFVSLLEYALSSNRELLAAPATKQQPRVVRQGNSSVVIGPEEPPAAWRQRPLSAYRGHAHHYG
jgi:hypothetical protein